MIPDRLEHLAVLLEQYIEDTEKTSAMKRRGPQRKRWHKRPQAQRIKRRRWLKTPGGRKYKRRKKRQESRSTTKKYRARLRRRGPHRSYGWLKGR